MALSTAVTAAGFCGQSEIMGRDERLIFDTVAGLKPSRQRHSLFARVKEGRDRPGSFASQPRLRKNDILEKPKQSHAESLASSHTCTMKK